MRHGVPRLIQSATIVGNPRFWCVGAICLTQIPTYCKAVLYGDETLVTLILTVFSIGIAAGSMLCKRLSRCKLRVGLVLLSSVGFTVFGILLYWHSGAFSQTARRTTGWQYWWVLLGIGLFGGVYIVPLYALIQSRAPEKIHSRVIASSNILNALLMVASAIMSIFFLSIIE
jgi:MFS family permease